MPVGVLLLTEADADAVDAPDTAPGRAEVASALAVLGVRAVDPRAVHPLLERLGAHPVRLADVLAGDQVRAALEQAEDDDLDEAERVADAVLTLVAAAVAAGDVRPGDLLWSSEVLLRDVDGEPAPAGELVLPGSHAEAVLDLESVAVVDTDLLRQWGTDVLRVVGVLDGLAVVQAGDVAVGEHEPDATVDVLDGWQAYAEQVLDDAAARVHGEPVPEAVLADVVAVRDLEVVREDAWPQVLARLAGDPLSRRAVVEPVRVLAGRQQLAHVPYTAWWLRGELCPAGLVADPAAAQAVRALLPAAPEVLVGLDPAMRRALGVVTHLDDVDVDAVAGILDRLADPAVDLPVGALVEVWGRLAALAAEGAQASPPSQVRALVAPHGRGGSAVVRAAEAVVVDAPFLLQHPLVRAAVLAPVGGAEDLADLLDLELASEVVRGVVGEDGADGGRSAEVPQPVRDVLTGAAATWCEHERLVVDGTEVDWWVDGEVVHAATVDGLARGLAWQAGQWGRRSVVSEILADPAGVLEVVVDEAFSPAGR